MKYQQDLEETKKYLKERSRPELENIIAATGLSKQKAKIILLKYSEEQDRWFIADEVHCAETKVSAKTTQALRKIRNYLIFAGYIKGPSTEQQILQNML